MKYDYEKIAARLRSLAARWMAYLAQLTAGRRHTDRIAFRMSYLAGMAELIWHCQKRIRDGAQPTGERPMMPLGLPA